MFYNFFKNTLTVFTLIAVVSAILLSSNDSFAAKQKETTTTITEASCKGSEDTCKLTSADGSTATSHGKASINTITTTTRMTQENDTGGIDTIAVDPDIPVYARCGEIWLSENDVNNLPITNVFIIQDQEAKTGMGFINVHHYYDGENDYYIREVGAPDAVTYNVYDWKLALGLPIYDDEILTVYPNPTSSNSSIKLNDAFLSAIDVQSASYQLIAPNGALVTTFNQPNPAVEVQIPSAILTQIGAYTIICNIEYLDTNNTPTSGTSNMSFGVQLMVTE